MAAEIHRNREGDLMDIKLNKKRIELIKKAYENGLHVEWYQKGDYYRYVLTQSIFIIKRKISTNDYQEVVSYNVYGVETKENNESLVIRIERPWDMSIMFHAFGDDEE